MVNADLSYDNVAPDTTGMPLLEFQGTLHEWNREVDEANHARAILNFTQVEVIKTEAKWDMPVAPIRFGINVDDNGRVKPRSSLGRFLHSMHGHGIEKLDDLIGKNVRMVAEVNSFTNDEGNRQAYKVWQIDHIVAEITIDPRG